MEVKFHFLCKYIKGTCWLIKMTYHWMLTVKSWLKLCLSGLSIVNQDSSISCFPDCTVWEEYLSGHLGTTSLRAECHRKHLEFCAGDSPSPRFIYSVIYFYKSWLMNIYFILWGVAQYYIIDFVAQIVHHWPQKFLKLALLSLWHIAISLFFEHFLVFWPNKISQDYHVCFLLIIKVSHFSKDFWFFPLEDEIRNQDLGARVLLLGCC